MNWQKIGNDFWTHVSKPFEYINGQLRDSNTKQLVLDLSDLSESPPFTSILAVLPPGLILPYGGSVQPSGNWALLLGTGINVSRTTYSLLFSILGTTFGSGDGSTTFGLPSTAGIHLRGVGESIGYDSPVTITLAEQINDEMHGHFHQILSNGNSVRLVDSTVTPGSTLASGNGIEYSSPNTSIPVSDGINGTPRTGSETRVKALGVNYIITTGLPV